MQVMKEENQIKQVCERFGLKGEYRYYKVINSGHINTTYCVYYFRDGEVKDYILQKVNTYLFKNPIEVMENISSVTEFIRAKIKQKKETSCIILKRKTGNIISLPKMGIFGGAVDTLMIPFVSSIRTI